jgi:NDP-sugar pyrophosphorylase family protein
MINIVIPMAGRGSRFAKEGYALPKPLIRVGAAAMIELVIENLRPSVPHRFIFLCLQDHLEEYPLEALLRSHAPDAIVIPIAGVTQGAACTVLLAKEHIDSSDPLMIANSDQWVDCAIDDYLRVMDERDADGLIMTMTATDPKWSFIGVAPPHWVREVVEKRVISHEATVGIYNYHRGSDFVAAAEGMIADNLRVNDEFYVAPAYNGLIAAGKRITYYNVGSEGEGMYGLGIPTDLQLFEAHAACPGAIQAALDGRVTVVDAPTR